MLKILCLCKWVADEAYIRADSGGNLDFSMVEYRMNEYDRNALEEAVRLKGEQDADITLMTVTTPEHGKAVKDGLSRGADRAIFVSNDAYKELEPAQTAAVMAAVIQGPDAYDLILCGEGSSDLYASQVGPRLAYRLGIPSVSGVSKLDIKEGQVIAERKNLRGSEIVSLPLPCLASLSPEINTPRIPGLKDTLSAAKKPVEELDELMLSLEENRRLQRTGLTYARLDRNVQILPASGEGIQEMARILVSGVQKGG